MDRIRLAIWTFMLLLFSVTIWGDEIYFRSLGVKRRIVSAFLYSNMAGSAGGEYGSVIML